MTNPDAFKLKKNKRAASKTNTGPIGCGRPILLEQIFQNMWQLFPSKDKPNPRHALNAFAKHNHNKNTQTPHAAPPIRKVNEQVPRPQ